MSVGLGRCRSPQQHRSSQRFDRFADVFYLKPAHRRRYSALPVGNCLSTIPSLVHRTSIARGEYRSLQRSTITPTYFQRLAKPDIQMMVSVSGTNIHETSMRVSLKRDAVA